MRIQAQFVIVDSQRILTNAQVEVRRGRIVGLSETPQVQPDLLLRDSVLLPGFINAHTHLEFSDLQTPISAGSDFPSWIAAVVQRRRELATNSTPQELAQQRRRAIQMGYQECCDAGTALILDTVTEPWNPHWLDDFADLRCKLLATPRVIALAEILGLEPQRLDQSSAWAGALSSEARTLPEASALLDVGLSPHATYSLLYPQIRDVLSNFSNQQLIAMHVAESLDERQWLDETSGPFRDFFQHLGLNPTTVPMRIGEAIELLSTYNRSLLIHGNYLNSRELDEISKFNMALVYCPRTHQHFSHSLYPLKDIVRREIPLLLGTDSRASNPDLNIWQDCKTAVALHSKWPASSAFDAITISAARFFGVDHDLGSLDVNKLAYINTIETPLGATKENLIALLLSSATFSYPQPLTKRNFARQILDY